MPNFIEPRILKGFRDSLPENEILRRKLIRVLEDTFQSFGFAPIDTPALEYSEILLGKGGGETDAQVYRFKDHGDRDVALRFDLTVPFARFMATYWREVSLPFKRYHIGKVWRGENTQRGRYREFMQCDFDIVGTDSVSADLEILLLIKQCFDNIGVSDITIEINHRGVLNKLFESLGCQEHGVEILRLIDKLRKIGFENVRAGLSEFLSKDIVQSILDFITTSESNQATVAKMTDAVGGPNEDSNRLAEISRILDESEITCVRINPAITRGLDYYTGLVYETFLDSMPDIGSVCSGGRYNDLASLYTKQNLPGAGASVGLDRLIAALEEIQGEALASTPSQVMVMMFDSRYVGHYHRIANAFRAAGIRSEVYHQEKKLGPQFQYAEKRGIPLGVLCGEDEIAKGTVILKNLVTRESFDDLSLENAVTNAADLLANTP